MTRLLRLLRRPVLAGALAGSFLAGGAGWALAGGSGGPGDSDRMATVEITMRHSRFTPARIAVEPGTPVRFVVRNADPIPHEFIVGPDEVHRRHEQGTEAWHAPRPGEVSVAAFDEAETTWVFDRPGTIAFGCHLPGHWDYGMHGEVDVSSGH